MPRSLPLALLLAGGLTAPAAAQEGAAALAIALDGLAQAGEACRLTFVARNGLDGGVDPLVLEGVAFDREGGVARISLFDFGALPAGRTRVRQFDLADTDCAAVGGLLINGVQRCEGVEGCADALAVSSRADVELLD